MLADFNANICLHNERNINVEKNDGQVQKYQNAYVKLIKIIKLISTADKSCNIKKAH